MALEIDLEAIQGSARDLTKAKQIELNVDLKAAGLPEIVVDGVVGPQTLQAIEDVAALDDGGEVDKSCPLGQHWDEGLQQCVDDAGPPESERPDMPPSAGLSGTQQWVWNEGTKEWDKTGSDAATITANAKKEAAKKTSAFNAELRSQSSRDTMSQLLRGMFGNDPRFATEVTALTTQLENLMIKGASELEIAQTIRSTDVYGKRFPGMAARALAGMPAISEAAYIGLESDYRNLMRTSGLDEKFYKDPARFGELIAGDVSAAEIQSRIGLAEAAVDGSDAATREQLELYYGIDRTKLVEYYLDPDEAVNLFEEERKLQSAGLSAAALSATGQAFNIQTAEALERENVQRREVQQRLSQRAGLTQRLLGEEEALTASEIAQGEFGLEAEATAELRRRREGRTAGFAGSAGVLTGRGGITGLGSA